MEGSDIKDENGESLVIIIKLELENEETVNSHETIDSKETLYTEEERSEIQFENIDKQRDAALENESIIDQFCDEFQMRKNELTNSEKGFMSQLNGSQQSLMKDEDDSVEENDTLVFDDENNQSGTIFDYIPNLSAPQATELKTEGIEADGGIGEINGNETEGSNEVENKCKKCFQDFANKTSLLLHIDDKHPEVRNPRPLPCKFCDDIFTIKPRLVSHMEKVHGKSYELVMKEQEKTNRDGNVGACGWCGKEYKRVKALRNHERLHTGETPFDCNLCGNSFGLKARLDSHMRSRHKLTVLDEAGAPEEINSENYVKDVNGNLNNASIFRMEAKHVSQESLNREADKFEDETTDYLKREQNVILDADDGTNFVRKSTRFVNQIRSHANVQNLTGEQLENGGEVYIGESPYICDYEGCEKVFTEYPALKSHLKMHNSEQPFRCFHDDCGKTFTRNFKLKAHMRTHKGELPFACEWEGCGKKFNLSDQYKRHLMTHTGEKPHICNVCQRRFSRADHLKKHVTGCVSSSIKVKVEKNRKHRQKREDNVNTDNLTQKQNVKKSLSHTGDQNIPKRLVRNVASKVSCRCEHCQNPEAFQGHDSHLCDYEGCEKTCATVTGLKNHLRKRHQEQLFVCNFEGCSEKFENYTKLRIHFITHIGKPPYLCDHGDCGKSFKIYPALKFHMKKHNGGRPHSCTHEGCGISFMNKTKLINHLRTHTGEKPYVCGECNVRFARKEYLQKHMRTHTGEKPHVCNRCNKGFSQGHHLKNHATRCVAAS